jgi:ribonuclease BN (tRNA processing enzyme)
VDLIVLGSSGSYGSEASPCSGYLVCSGDTLVWMDCGNGTFANLQHHVDPADLSAVVITHEHPDHCVDLYGLHVMYRYGLECGDLPVYAPPGAEHRLGALVTDWGGAFDWREIEDAGRARVGDIDFRFSRTDHPPPTYAVEASAEGRRLIYTADTGPRWSVDAFDPGADLVLSEATYLHEDRHTPIHLSARQAGEAARAAKARRLMLTHLWPRLDSVRAVEEGSEAFGEPVMLAGPHMVTAV